MDTGGEERFRSITTNYYRNADCCLLVYDITDKNSFEEIKNFFNEKVKEKCKENIPIILLGNKTDLENQRQVQPEDGANFCTENGYIFMETSCLKNRNVADAFETLIELANRDALTRKGTAKNEKKITVSKADNKKDKKSCSC
jgi:small GTP-binding protein